MTRPTTRSLPNNKYCLESMPVNTSQNKISSKPKLKQDTVELSIKEYAEQLSSLKIPIMQNKEVQLKEMNQASI